MKTRKLDMTVMLLYILSGIISYTKFSILRYPLLFIGLFIQIAYYFYSNKRIRKLKVKRFDLLYITYIIVSILSSIFTKSFDLFFGSILMMVLFISFRLFFEKNNIYHTLYTICIAFTIVNLISIAIVPIKLISYSGIYYNPNSLGTTSVTLFTSLLIIIYMNIESGTNIKKRIYLMLIFSIFMVIISSSRTSFNVLLMEIVLIILFLLIEKRIKIKYTIIVSIITILIIILLKDVIYDSIISKFLFKSEDLLDGRFEVWSVTIKELRLFGHGRDYFINLGLGAHSTYISIMGQYGLLSFIFFTLFFIDILIKTRISNPFKRSYIVWASSSLFLILSLAEGMINSPAMMIALYVFFANNNFSLVGLKIKEKDLNLLETERITI